MSILYETSETYLNPKNTPVIEVRFSALKWLAYVSEYSTRFVQLGWKMAAVRSKNNRALALFL